MRLLPLLSVALSAAAYLEAPMAALRAPDARRTRIATAPAMIIDQLKEAADSAKAAADAAATELKGAAAEVIVQQKVADKLAKAREKYDIPDKYVNVMEGFFTSYMTQVYLAGNDIDYYEKVLTDLFKQVLEKTKEPHKFEPYHKAMREPYDYYALGNDFATGVINREDSSLIGIERIQEIQEKVAAGDNVVLLANHQSEADPQIFSVLLDPEFPGFAENVIFVAGDRVTTDLLAQPFSMGRNLLCIFSKKHVENPPELKAEKTKHNRNVMKQMQGLFKEGGKIIWVAPSGGRDRRGDNGDYSVAPFDSKSVEMFRLMANKAGRTTHFYPLSMLTYPICPPPEQVGGDVGERRTVKWSPAGLHFAEAVDLSKFAEGCLVDGFPTDCDPAQQRDMLRDALSEHVHGIVSENYKSLTAELKPFLE